MSSVPGTHIKFKWGKWVHKIVFWPAHVHSSIHTTTTNSKKEGRKRTGSLAFTSLSFSCHILACWMHRMPEVNCVLSTLTCSRECSWWQHAMWYVRWQLVSNGSQWDCFSSLISKFLWCAEINKDAAQFPCKLYIYLFFPIISWLSFISFLYVINIHSSG